MGRFLSVLLLLAACTVPPSPQEASSTRLPEDGAAGLVAAGRTGLLDSSDKAWANKALPTTEPDSIERSMIYAATLTLEVPRVEETIEQLHQRIGELGGYFSMRSDTTLTFRVPAPRFESLLAELRALGRVLGQTITARDVTKEHVDLQLRLENAKKSRERLLALLERADKVDDVLKVEEALRRLTEEIERIEGELKLLQSQIAFATVTVSFRAAAANPQSSQAQPHTFWWLESLGVEHVLRNF